MLPLDPGPEPRQNNPPFFITCLVSGTVLLATETILLPDTMEKIYNPSAQKPSLSPASAIKKVGLKTKNHNRWAPMCGNRQAFTRGCQWGYRKKTEGWNAGTQEALSTARVCYPGEHGGPVRKSCSLARPLMCGWFDQEKYTE